MQVVMTAWNKKRSLFKISLLIHVCWPAGKFANIHSLEALKAMPEWTAKNPLRVVTGYFNVARRFFEDNGFEHIVLLSADGALVSWGPYLFLNLMHRCQ